jgi:hypothetical protein
MTSRLARYLPATLGQINWIKNLRGKRALADHQDVGLKADLEQGMSNSKAALWLRVLLSAPEVI